MPPPEPAGGEQRLAGDTVVSGVPHPTPEPAPAAPKSGKGKQAKAGKAGKKKGGRSKLVLAGVAVVGVCGVAYGAGLLLDHADVPKNTTVLGVEIGG